MSPTTEIIQRKAIGNQVWYVRGTAVTGDMYVYTIEEVRENGQGVRAVMAQIKIAGYEAPRTKDQSGDLVQ